MIISKLLMGFALPTMMLAAGGTGVLALATSGVSGATTHAEGEKKTTDLAMLQGRWRAEAAIDKKKVAVIWVIKDTDIHIYEIVDGKQRASMNGIVSIDDRLFPKELTIINLKGKFVEGGKDHKFPDILAIYEVNNNNLKVCYNRPDESRPPKFGPRVQLPPGTIILKREE
jgi:uncharacterized protein (TIGR03067 family)